ARRLLSETSALL
ncbi:acyl-CoA dehydrogenase, C-terminal domain protein, partial [Vibrio parahaemolyticus V-223/04]